MNIYLKNISCAFLVFQIFISSAYANDSEVTFENVLDAALLKSPALSKIQSQISKEKADALSLSTLPNPELSAETRPYLSSGSGGDSGRDNGNDTEYEVSISQTLKPSSLGKKSAVAKLINEGVSLDEKLALHELNQSLFLLYGKVWALQEKELSIKAAEKRIQGLLNKLTLFAREGLFPKSTIKLFEASSAKLSGQFFGVSADKARALAAITKESGLTLKEKRLKPLELKKLSTFKELRVDKESMPIHERVRLKSKIANAQYELARLDAFPKFAPRIAYEHTDSGDERINFGVTIDIPFFDRNQAERLRTGANRAEQNSLREYVEGDAFRDELELLLTAAQSSEKQALLYKETIIPALNASLSATEREFESGQGNPFQIWQTLSEFVEAQDRYLELWIKALSERVELSILLGRVI